MSIFHKHILPARHKLYRFALRITGNVQEAEDVVQEVLTKAWSTSEQIDGAQSIRSWEAWCMTLTHRQSIDKLRSRTLRRTSPLELVPETGNQLGTQLVENRDLINQVQQLMNRLPERQRLVMHLRDIEEMSYEEIAHQLEISIDQVKTYLHRARKTIREQLINQQVQL
jgi:RNA polymerase sigma-70 factor (ECF subfamily)